MEKQEKNVDIKGTFKKFISPEEPQLEQKSAIIKYNDNQDDDEDGKEEYEHLKRVKHELLEALKRVEDLEKKLYGSNGKKEMENNIKVKSKERNIVSQKNQIIKKEIDKEDERE